MAEPEHARTSPWPPLLKPDALGLGLRPSHLEGLGHASQGPDVLPDFLEVLLDNHLGASPLPRQRLASVARKHPLVGHSVSLNLLGTDPLDAVHLGRMAALVRQHRMPMVTDHLCWSASAGRPHHDLLPFPYAEDLVPYAVARIRAVQAALGVPFGVENLSSYLSFTRDEMPEWAFVRRVVEGADCGLLLDVNNVVVSSVNHGFAVEDYLRQVPWDRVMYVHVAGHQVREDGLRHDTHDRAVSDAVWAAYGRAWKLGGPFPTVLEWDADIPALNVAVAELERARRARSS